MQTQRQATELMAKISYQLRPPASTTMAPCKSCQRPSPGGQPCAQCLAEELMRLIDNRGAVMRWMASLATLEEDQATIMAMAKSRQ